MPNITLPNYPFADGDTPTGTDVSENLYEIIGGVPNSYEVINGHLNIDNLDASWTEIDRTSVQRNTLSLSDEVGTTTNLDYISALFTGFAPVEADLADPNYDAAFSTKYMAVPGLGISFYLPYRAIVVFTWNVMWMNASKPSGPAADVAPVVQNQSLLRFFLDDAIQGYTWKREVHPTLREDAAGAGAGLLTHFGKNKNRYWNGHFTVELDAGFHSASVRILCSANVPQTRVFNRGFRYLAFQRPVGT